jgi:uncharacterized membrane protein YdfJ with MMPL/SSD domain
MDYQVFLLLRILERLAATGGTTEAVVAAVASTARIITGAALIIIAVFVGFAAGELVIFQQMGFGVAVALLTDRATIVRSVLVPAARAGRTGTWRARRSCTGPSSRRPCRSGHAVRGHPARMARATASGWSICT